MFLLPRLDNGTKERKDKNTEEKILKKEKRQIKQQRKKNVDEWFETLRQYEEN